MRPTDFDHRPIERHHNEIFAHFTESLDAMVRLLIRHEYTLSEISDFVNDRFAVCQMPDATCHCGTNTPCYPLAAEKWTETAGQEIAYRCAKCRNYYRLGGYVYAMPL